MIYQPGQIVKYTNPENAEEAALRMVVIEDRDTRLLVRHNLKNFTLQPQESFDKSNYELAGE